MKIIIETEGGSRVETYHLPDREAEILRNKIDSRAMIYHVVGELIKRVFGATQID